MSNLPLYQHQLTALQRAASEGGLPLRRGHRVGFAYLMDTRTGKSRTAVEEIAAMWRLGALDVVLLLAPKGVYGNWYHPERGELAQWLPTDVRRRVVEWRAGKGGVLHGRKLDGLLTSQEDELRVCVMNSEALSSGGIAWEYAIALLQSKTRGSMLLIDESVDFGEPTSNRTRRVVGGPRIRLPLRDLADYRRILCGLLTPRGPLQAWSQFEVLAPGCLDYRSFHAFRARYAVTKRVSFGGRSFDQVVGYQREDELSAAIARHSFRIRRDQCWDLPKTVYTRRAVELTTEQARAYAQVRDAATTELASGDHVTATAVITQIMRLHQIACGHVVDESGQHHDLPTNRPAELVRVTQETDDKVIVWCHFRRDVELACAALREEWGADSVVEYHGGTERADRPENVHLFQTHQQVRFFVATDAAAKGLKLTAAGTMVYYSNGYSWDKRSQSEDRPLGADQRGAVHCVDLVAPDTVEERILDVLRQHKDLASAVMGDAYREWLQ